MRVTLDHVEVTRKGRREAPPGAELAAQKIPLCPQHYAAAARGPDPQRHVGWGWERRRWSVGRALPWVGRERSVPSRRRRRRNARLSITCKTPRLTLIGVLTHSNVAKNCVGDQVK